MRESDSIDTRRIGAANGSRRRRGFGVRFMTDKVGVVLLATIIGGCGGDASNDAASSSPASNRTSRATTDEPVQVEATVDETEVDIGEKVTYTVTVRYDPNLEVELPAVLSQFENWVLFDVGTWTEPKSIGTKVEREIESVLDPGLGPVLVIPSTTIRYRRPSSDSWNEARTSEITVEIIDPSGGDEPEFREPLDAIPLPPAPPAPGPDQTTLLLAIVGGTVLLFGTLWFFLLRKKRTRAVRVPPAHEVALDELDRLAEMGLIGRGEVKPFYYRLTDILRRYIEIRFEIEAPKQTTEEFLHMMRGSDVLTPDHKQTLEEFLRAADLVKYARHEPEASEAGAALDIARHFVRQTSVTEPAEIRREVVNEV